MPYVAPLGIWGSYIALGFCILIALTKGFTSFLLKKKDKTFDRQKFMEQFITGYATFSIPPYFIFSRFHH
jgi:amino acid transporter